MTLQLTTDENDTHWTINYLIDRLKQHLATFELLIQNSNNNDSIQVFDNRKYYNLAHHFLKIGAFKPVPTFPLSIADLSTKTLELNELDVQDRSFVLKQAVGRIFEDINCKLYHDSISRVLEVRLVE